MSRSLSAWSAGALTLVTGFGTAAFAEDNQPAPLPGPAVTGPRLAIPTPLEAFTPHDAQISTILYLNRCTGGCLIKMGNINDARADTSTIPTMDASISEFALATGETGVAANEEWNAIVKCMREVYSPFNVQVVDQRPQSGLSFHQAIVAGVPPEIGRGNDILGVAPLAGDCTPQDNVVSFSFANAHSPNERVNNICWTAAQESAHAFGLDHEYEFVVGARSACNDPMTYRSDCGGQKFFRNDSAKCGEFTERPCLCGPVQNSHAKILSVFEAGTVITPKPTVSVTFPMNGATIANNVNVNARAFSHRGIQKMELYLNGRKWSEVPGAAFGSNGQPESTYALPVPGMVPNSIIDVVVKAYDDLGLMSESPVVTVTKGAACTDDASCVLNGMKCNAGKCAWDPASGEIGEACTYNEFCLSDTCTATSSGSVCSTECHPGVQDECPESFVCEMTGVGVGVCLASAEDAGCCSVGSSREAVVIHFGLGLGVLGLVLRRRKRTARA